MRYGFTGGGDSPDLILDGQNTLLEQVIGLAGGVTVTKTSTTQSWSYPNIHGDITVTADAAGTRSPGVFRYDPVRATDRPDHRADQHRDRGRRRPGRAPRQ
ncbi:hypothetical protein ASG80_01900 [Agromyces sp. Soil535]|nr:hypothetical protein ASG80_01900 [Agromyces sp. Soil535]